MCKDVARPFLKWAGGKGQLLNTFKRMFPKELAEGKIKTYIEPFVGGGAVLFYILQNYDIEKAYINDINKELINCYRCIKANVEEVISQLKTLEREYLFSDDRTKYFYVVRNRYNEIHLNGHFDFEKCADFIFLNKTCFNGLYRVNRKGEFNVPHGKYKNPLICDPINLRLCSKLLQKVEISFGGYEKVLDKIDKNTFVYFDPPYRPLGENNSFVSYDKSGFNDNDQVKLSDDYKNLNKRGCLLMLSNSDPKNTNENDNFFDDLYQGFKIERVYAKRMINCQASRRGDVTEIVVMNYKGENTMCDNDEKYFVRNTLDTNRGYNYYVNWENAKDYNRLSIELCALDSLIGITDDSMFKTKFCELLEKIPSVLLTFPYLFALSKAERNYLLTSSKNKLKIIGSELVSDDFQTYTFSKEDIKNINKVQIEKYYNFFEQMGLKALFQTMLSKSTMDYVIGVLVGLDSNGRKNRGGDAFELACEPIIQQIVEKYGLNLLKQKQFKVLSEQTNISDDIANRKADFIIYNDDYSKILNIEVNFYNGSGSKPEEIVDSYINRQKDLQSNGIYFVLITDGACWKNDTNQLQKAFRHLKCISNFRMLKNGVIEKYIRDVFVNGKH